MIGSPTITNTATTGDVFVIKLDSLGNYIWADSYGGTGSDWGMAIDVDQNGYLNMAGYFKSPSIIFGTDTLTNTGTAGSKDLFITKLSSSFVSDVWPGDANHDYIVNNNDLLPLGLYYGQTGFARSAISNVWQADSSADWGITQSNLSDIKHVDCNGDGTINMNDTLAINLNFSSAHAMQPTYNAFRSSLPEMYFVIPGSSFIPAQWVTVELWLGTSTNPVSGLYGLSFDINYDPLLIESGTENLTFTNSWFGNPGTDAIKLAKFNPSEGTLYGAETRINHLNANGFGKIADLTFQISTTATTGNYPFTIIGYQTNDSTGNSLFFNTIPDSIFVHTSSADIADIENKNTITVSPNPSNGTFVFSKIEKENTIEIIDITGRVIMKTVSEDVACNINLDGKAKGIYFYRVKEQNKTIQQGKIILQ